MKNIINYLEKNKKYVSIAKIFVLSILMLLSLKWVAVVNVMLVVAILFVLTEFDFDGIYLLFFLISFRFVFRNNLTGNLPYVTIVFAFFILSSVIKYVFV